MDVKGELKSAQLELVDTSGNIIISDSTKLGMVKYGIDTGDVYLADGTRWKKVYNDKSYIRPIGCIEAAFLDEFQFQVTMGEIHGIATDKSWVLCDGRNVIGSDYEALTGNSNIPDLRGVALRGLDNGRGFDPGRTLGSYQADDNKSHTHSFPKTFNPIGPGSPTYYGAASGAGSSISYQSTTSSGGSEARMKNVAVNFFIKIYKEPRSV